MCAYFGYVPTSAAHTPEYQLKSLLKVDLLHHVKAEGRYCLLPALVKGS